MADWEAFRSELESAETRQPPLDRLRERRRRRQQRRTLAATMSVVLVGSAAGLALLGQGSTPSGGAPRVPGLNSVVTSTKLPPPTNYTDYVVTDVDFVSPTTGWSLGLRCVGDRCDIATWRTDDGGGTWGQAVPVATGVPRATYHDEDPSGGAVRSIRMVDGKLGYAFNPDLYVTTDGARTWTRLPRQSKVTSVSPGGPAGDGAVWVTERGCAAGVDCDLVVSTATVAAGAPVDLPETNGARALVRSSGERSYLVTWSAPADPASFWRTSQAGWRRGTMPCQDAEAVSLSARADAPLWLVCTGPGGGRTAWTSTDHGTTWNAVSGAPGEGVVTDLLAAGPDEAWLTTQTPGAIWHWTSRDGWRNAGVPKAYGYANLDLAGDRLYAMGDAGELWVGPLWHKLLLPPGGGRVPAAPAARGLNDASVHWTGVTFLDARTGWAVGERCAEGECAIVTARTSDGGVTWAAPDSPGERLRARPEARAWRIRLVDRASGWVWSDDATFEGTGFGHIWHRVAGAVVDVRVGVAADGTRVPWTLYSDRLAAGTQRVRDVTGRPLLAVAGADHAYLAGERFYGTADRGKTWYEGSVPCAVGSLSAYAPGRLWAICRGATNEAVQRQARSSDGGRTWTVTDLPGTGAATGEIVAFSDSYAWRTGANRGVLVTRDGGRTWTGSTHVAERVLSMTFADERHGWLISANALYRTTDGVTWERLG